MTVHSSTIATGQDPDSEPLSQAGQQAGDSVAHLAERATDVGFRQADRGKEQAAHGITQVAESIRRVGDDIEGEQPAIATVAQTAAAQADRIASYLQHTDVRDIVRTVEDVARRQPILFLGGAFLIGVAATRLLKVAAAGEQSTTGRGYGKAYGSGTTSSMSPGYGATSGVATAESYRATGPGSTSLDELPEEGI